MAAWAVARLTLPVAPIGPIALLVGEIAIGASAVVLALGLERLRSRELLDAVVQQARGQRGILRDALARLLDDPGLELGFWSADQGAYLVADGMGLVLPALGSRRVVTAVERDGEPVAAIVHDEALLKERDALEAIATATRLAASNDRLHTQLRVQLDELEASRQRLRVAEDDARRRLEERLERSGAARIRAAVAMLGEAATVTSRAGTTTIAESRGHIVRRRPRSRTSGRSHGGCIPASPGSSASVRRSPNWPGGARCPSVS